MLYLIVVVLAVCLIAISDSVIGRNRVLITRNIHVWTSQRLASTICEQDSQLIFDDKGFVVARK